MTRPDTTSQAQVKLIHSLSTLTTHAMDERKQDGWHLNGKDNNDGEGRQKVLWKAHINEENHKREKDK